MLFTSTKYEDLGPLVAYTNIATGELVINPGIWEKLPDFIRRFILLHEEGHLVNGSLDEAAADDYAAKMFIDRTDPDAFARTSAEYYRIQEIYKATTEAERQELIAEISQVPGGKERAGFITAIIGAVVALGTTAYSWISSSDAERKAKRKAEQDAQIAAAQAELAKERQKKIMIYLAAGALGIALIYLILS